MKAAFFADWRGRVHAGPDRLHSRGGEREARIKGTRVTVGAILGNLLQATASMTFSGIFPIYSGRCAAALQYAAWRAQEEKLNSAPERRIHDGPAMTILVDANLTPRGLSSSVDGIEAVHW